MIHFPINFSQKELLHSHTSYTHIQAVDGVAMKDTPAKHALPKMLPVTNAKKKDTFKLCRRSAQPTKKVWELEEDEEQEEGDEVPFLGEI